MSNIIGNEFLARSSNEGNIIDDELFASDLLDTAIALQKSDEDLTEKFSSKGYNRGIYNGIIEKLANTPHVSTQFSSELDDMLELANISIPKELNMEEFFKRKGRSVVKAITSSDSLQNLDNILTRNSRHISDGQRKPGVYQWNDNM